jgi:hypothetical protein
MSTQNSINSNIPIEITKGGTNATSFSTANGIVKYDGTRLVSSTTATIDASNRMTNTAQPAFLANRSADASNITGDGTTWTMICDYENFDQANNFNGTTTFTAPKTGIYFFPILIAPKDLSASFTYGEMNIVTTSRTYRYFINVGAAMATPVYNNIVLRMNALCDMTAGDTATFTLKMSGGTKTVGIQGDGGAATKVNSKACFLAC